MTAAKQSRALLLASLAIGSWETGATPQESREAVVLRGVDRAQAWREASLSGYAVTEKYTVHNLRFHSAAEMTVNAVFRKEAGKTYQVVSRSGSSLLQTRVLDRLLIEEAAMSRGAAWQHSRLTSENYTMRLIGKETLAGRPCEVIELKPRVKSPHVLAGRAWVDPTDYSLVRIEGKLVAGVSFFGGRPSIVREYGQIDGLAFARRSQAVSDGLFFGRTELTIEYSSYKITRTAKK